jgi:hypothetical protein
MPSLTSALIDEGGDSNQQLSGANKQRYVIHMYTLPLYLAEEGKLPLEAGGGCQRLQKRLVVVGQVSPELHEQ